MAQPIYFLPDLREAAAKDVAMRKSVLRERGLLDVFADVPHDQQPLWELPGRGPDNRAGCLLFYQTPTGQVPRRTGYHPAEQVWTPVGDGSLLWIGVDTAEPPRPEEMARRKQYGGYTLTLGDGNDWQVPVIRRPDDSTLLPTDMVWDATGKLIEPIKPAYQAYWEETAETVGWFLDESHQPDRSRALTLAIRALSLNYRFGVNEQNALRVIDAETLFLVLAATVDAPNQKKTDRATSVNVGSGADCQTTVPAAGICT